MFPAIYAITESAATQKDARWDEIVKRMRLCGHVDAPYGKAMLATMDCVHMYFVLIILYHII